jgi:hypothetical protein
MNLPPTLPGFSFEASFLGHTQIRAFSFVIACDYWSCMCYTKLLVVTPPSIFQQFIHSF